MFGKLGQYNKQNFNTFFFFNTLQSSINYNIKHVPEFCVILAGVLLQVQEKFHKLCTGSQLSIFHWQMQKENSQSGADDRNWALVPKWGSCGPHKELLNRYRPRQVHNQVTSSSSFLLH